MTATEDGLLIVDTLVPAPCEEPVEVVFQCAPTVDVCLSGAGVLVSDRERAASDPIPGRAVVG